METTRSTDGASLLRTQFRVLESVGAFDSDAQRRVLLIARKDWPKWSAFAQGGPLPPHPAPPVMLQRVAAASYRLAALIDRRTSVGRPQ